MNLSLKNENYTYSSLTLSLEYRQYFIQFFTAISKWWVTIEYLADYWGIDPIWPKNSRRCVQEHQVQFRTR
jgi:hypothetical protein